MRNFLSFISVTLSFTAVFGQSLIIPGSKLLRYETLINWNNSYKTQLIDQNGKVKYESLDTKQLIVDKKKGQLILVQNKKAMSDQIIDSTFAVLNTLLPIRMSMSSSSKQNNMDLRFKGETIHAKVDRMGTKKDTIHAIKEPYFDSNLLETLLGIIDYNKDTLFKVNTYTYEMNGLDSYLIKRIGKETIELSGHPKLNTWHIIIYQEKAFKQGNKMGYEFWIESDWGVVVKQVISFGEGKGTYIITIEPK